jgi:hypothetical protein
MPLGQSTFVSTSVFKRSAKAYEGIGRIAVFFPENFRINEVVHTLVDKGVWVEVLTGKPNHPEGVFFPGYRAWRCQTQALLGAKVYRVPMAAKGSHSALWLVLNYFSFVFSGLLFAAWLLPRQKYDAVLVYGVSLILQAPTGALHRLAKKMSVLRCRCKTCSPIVSRRLAMFAIGACWLE